MEKEDDSKVVDHKAEERKEIEDPENPNDGCPSSAGISTSPKKVQF